MTGRWFRRNGQSYGDAPRFPGCVRLATVYTRVSECNTSPPSTPPTPDQAEPAMLPFPPRFLPAKGPPRLSARERVLAQWRGMHLGAVEKAARPSARSTADVMPGVLRGLHIEKRQSETEILKVWNELLDPNLTAHAQPTGIHRGTLFVTVDSNVWLSEIVRYRRHEILDRLRHAFGRDLVRKISFRAG